MQLVELQIASEQLVELQAAPEQLVELEVASQQYVPAMMAKTKAKEWAKTREACVQYAKTPCL